MKCNFSYVGMGFTPVDNNFIKHYMPEAPDGFVKIYLYALFLSFHQQDESLEQIAAALSVSPEELMGALGYWENLGLLTVIRGEELQVQLEPVIAEKPIQVYGAAHYVAELRELFAPRDLSAAAIARIHEWTDVYGLPQEVVLILVSHCLDHRGKRVSIEYMDKTARTWADEGVFTKEDALQRIEKTEKSSSSAAYILKHLSIYRLPTKDELDLIEKWQQKWGFSLSAILAACRETTKSSSPNMAYLDKILYNLHQNSCKTTQQVSVFLTDRNALSDRLKELLYLLGQKGRPTNQNQEQYENWLEMGFSYDAVKRACSYIASKGGHSFSAVDQLLHSLGDLELFTPSQLQERFAYLDQLDEDVKVIYQRLSMQQSVSQTHREAYERWAYELGMPFEVILLAAEYSRFAANKFAFLNKLLLSWHEKKVATVSAARKDYESGQKAFGTQGRSAADKPQHNYMRHDYDIDQLEKLFELPVHQAEES
ncbi:MAG: DnaD domain protein [Christensenellales bacterium]